MKIGAMDVMWHDLPFKERITRIAELGFEGFQPWLLTAELGFKIPFSWFPHGNDFKRILMSPREVKELAHEKGIDITCFGPHYVLGEPPLRFGYPGISEFKSESSKKDRIEDIKRLIIFAADAEVDTVTLFSGGDPGKKEYWKQFIEIMNIIVDFAEKFNVTLAMENMPQLLINDEEMLIKLIKDVGSKNLKINFDPKNLNVLGRNIIKAVKKIQEHIVYSHAGDSIPGSGYLGKGQGDQWIMPVLGKGTIPFPEYIKTLKKIRYSGWVVIEYSGDKRGYEKGMIESKKYLENLILKIY